MREVLAQQSALERKSLGHALCALSLGLAEYEVLREARVGSPLTVLLKLFRTAVDLLESVFEA